MQPSRSSTEIRKQTKELPASPVTLKRDVPYELVYYLRERQERVPRGHDRAGLRAQLPARHARRPHVRLRQRGQRRNSSKRAALQAASTRRPGRPDRRRVRLRPLLRGQSTARPGSRSTRSGGRRASRSREREPEAGNNLRLTIDSEVQAAGEAAIGQFGLPGAFVAMDVDDGEVLGLGSAPDLRPLGLHRSRRSRRRPSSCLNSEETGAPQANRAIQGLYPTGSTFKLITATAALEEGLITPDETVDDPASFTVGGVTFENAGEPPTARSTCTTRSRSPPTSTSTSSATRPNTDEQPMPIQDWAGRLGLGSPTGIDLPVGARRAGPDAGVARRALRQGRHRPPVDRAATTSTSRSARATCRRRRCRWRSPTRRSPTAATCPRPHLAQRVEDPSGRVVQEIDPAPRRQLDISTADARDDPRAACTRRRWSRAERPTRSSAGSRSRSPARPVPPSAAR